MMKKALLDQLFLGFLLLVLMIFFVSTVNDETNARNKVYDLKSFARKAATAAAKYYAFERLNTSEAEMIANNIIQEMTGGDVTISSYTWDFSNTPNTLTTTITNYQQKNFWYRFLEKDTFNISVSASVEFIYGNGLSTTSTPLAINACKDQTTNDETLLDDYIGPTTFTFSTSLSGNGNKFTSDSQVKYDVESSNVFFGLTTANNPTINSTNEQSDLMNNMKDETYSNTSDLNKFLLVNEQAEHNKHDKVEKGFESNHVLPRRIVMLVLGCDTTLSTTDNSLDIIDSVVVELSNRTNTNPYIIDFEIIGPADFQDVIPID